ncbi:methyltransferase-like protein 17, mitochondrial [Neocloeon triangulifer]|uniref:methyltransferase-like protein 17, mitochondrial n=1 Tax=Neocloeon triangulifer TaxID=2078957 RepID=UPI00286F309D|nr:methyltransferase-like protein 17, mitochondrial [Neocloeon triangulifer]XP_059471835.1 methyltransferase-like protein 17, mitochondrial [Neocloeon triangulifer]
MIVSKLNFIPARGCAVGMSFSRMMATKVKAVGLLDESLTLEASKDSFTGKAHPGKVYSAVADLPNPLQRAIDKVCQDENKKVLFTEGEKLARLLKDRFEPGKSTEKRKWKPTEYTKTKCLSYMLSRMPAEFSAVDRAFVELSKWAPNFVPRTLYDFGSGVGSVPWAAISRWSKQLEEIHCIDSSKDMVNLAELLLKGGEAGGKFHVPQTYFRQLMSPTVNRTFDLVVSAHTLFEFPSLEARLDAHINLWRKTKDYYVLVELGTREGFKLIDEAKEFILFQSKKEGQEMHILAPCPHSLACPRLLREGDRSPCNFESRYYKLWPESKGEASKERFSFVILGKGRRKSPSPSWPRMVRAPMVRSGHVICSLCTPEGKLEDVTFTKSKDGRASFLCARYSDWGDLVPVSLRQKEFDVRDKVKKENISENSDDAQKSEHENVAADEGRPLVN